MSIPVTTDSIWSLNTNKSYYKIPENIEFPQGVDIFQNLLGEIRTTNAVLFEQYLISEEDAFLYLKNSYTAQLDNTKKALMALNIFAVQTGRNDQSFMEQMVRDEFSDAEKDTPFAKGKDIVEGLLGHIRDTGKTEQEQQADFINLFGKIPDVAKFFDEKTLEEAAKNPEKWANEMNEKFFGKENAAKNKAKAEKLKKEVRESIERGLRSAGMEPEPFKDTPSSEE